MKYYLWDLWYNGIKPALICCGFILGGALLTAALMTLLTIEGLS